VSKKNPKSTKPAAAPAKKPPAITGPTTKGGSPLEGPVVAGKTAAGRKPKPKQQDLPGVEAKTPPKVEKAVLEYQEVRDERMELTKRETAAYAKMIAAIEDAKLDAKQPFSFLRDDGKRVQVFPEMKPEEFKVRVKLVEGEEE